MLAHHILNNPIMAIFEFNLDEPTQADAIMDRFSRADHVIEAKNLTKRTDFISNFIFINNAPAWINFDEGRVIMNGLLVFLPKHTSRITLAIPERYLGRIQKIASYILQ